MCPKPPFCFSRLLLDSSPTILCHLLPSPATQPQPMPFPHHSAPRTNVGDMMLGHHLTRRRPRRTNTRRLRDGVGERHWVYRAASFLADRRSRYSVGHLHKFADKMRGSRRPIRKVQRWSSRGSVNQARHVGRDCAADHIAVSPSDETQATMEGPPQGDAGPLTDRSKSPLSISSLQRSDISLDRPRRVIRGN